MSYERGRSPGNVYFKETGDGDVLTERSWKSRSCYKGIIPERLIIWITTTRDKKEEYQE